MKNVVDTHTYVQANITKVMLFDNLFVVSLYILSENVAEFL